MRWVMETVDLLKVFISDKILQRKEELVKVYGSAEEQQEQLKQLQRLQSEARIQNAVFNYAKWCSGRTEITVLENILTKIKTLEEAGEQDRLKHERVVRQK